MKLDADKLFSAMATQRRSSNKPHVPLSSYDIDASDYEDDYELPAAPPAKSAASKKRAITWVDTSDREESNSPRSPKRGKVSQCSNCLRSHQTHHWMPEYAIAASCYRQQNNCRQQDRCCRLHVSMVDSSYLLIAMSFKATCCCQKSP